MAETSTWTMMMICFGAAGGALRRRQRMAVKIRLA